MDNNLIELFRRRIRGFITDLKVIQDKHFRQSKMTPDILGNVEQVYLQFDFLREEKNGNLQNPQLIFGELLNESFFLEMTEIVINLRGQAKSALDDSREGKDSQWFDVWLMETINQMSEIYEVLPVDSDTQPDINVQSNIKTKRRPGTWKPKVVAKFIELNESGMRDKDIRSELYKEFKIKFSLDALKTKRCDLKKK